MSMIYCHGCGKEIHKTAITCPGCGAQQFNNPSSNTIKDGPFFYFVDAWKNSFNYSGRIRRKAYWYYFLFYLIFNILFTIFDDIISADGVLISIYTIAAIFPNISTGIRRMHDTGRSGWWILLPIVNLIFFMQDSKVETNEYGPSPKYAFS